MAASKGRVKASTTARARRKKDSVPVAPVTSWKPNQAIYETAKQLAQGDLSRITVVSWARVEVDTTGL